MSGDVAGDSKISNLQFGWPQYLKVSKAFEKFVPDVVHIVTEGPLGLTAMQAAKAKAIPERLSFAISRL